MSRKKPNQQADSQDKNNDNDRDTLAQAPEDSHHASQLNRGQSASRLSRFRLFGRRRTAPVKPSGWPSFVLLALALVVLVVAVILRVMMGFEESEIVQAIAHEKRNQTNTNQASELRSLDDVGTFNRQVEKVTFENVVRQIRTEHPEFKSADYLRRNQDKWTIEVLDVIKEEIILDYLITQGDDSKEYAYFRYVDPEDSKRYRLIYGVFDNQEAAQQALVTHEFRLPTSVSPTTKPVKGYLDSVDDYHLQSAVKDYGKRGIRDVSLAKTQPPKPVKSSDFGDPVLTGETVGESMKLNDNAFSSQPDRSARVIQPGGSASSSGRSSRVVIEDVPEEVVKKNSTTDNNSATEPRTQPEPSGSGDDQISRLIESIQ